MFVVRSTENCCVAESLSRFGVGSFHFGDYKRSQRVVLSGARKVCVSVGRRVDGWLGESCSGAEHNSADAADWREQHTQSHLLAIAIDCDIAVVCCKMNAQIQFLASLVFSDVGISSAAFHQNLSVGSQFYAAAGSASLVLKLDDERCSCLFSLHLYAEIKFLGAWNNALYLCHVERILVLHQQ